MASLNTFGAVFTHAINMEARLSDYFKSIGQCDQAKDADKRRSTLERIRREYVVEITLEPIEGLDEADYALNLDDTSESGWQAAIRTAARFYADSAPKINVRQAQRALEKCGKQYSEMT
jgi:hypothetical protein